MYPYQQARGSITKSRRHFDKSDSENLFRNIEVKISGLTGELSKEITDHLASLFKTVQPLIQFIDSQKSNKSDQGNGGGDVQSRDVIKYADVKIQEVTFFLRCSKCPEMTLFRLDDLSVDRKRNQVKARDPRTTLSADEPVKIGPVKTVLSNLDNPSWNSQGPIDSPWIPD